MKNNGIGNKKESILNRILRIPFLLTGLRLFNLVVLGVMVYYSYSYYDINGIDSADPLMYTNAATFLFWVFWIEVIVISVLVLGRMWCAICPLGWLNGILSTNFLKLEYPAKLKNNFLLILFTFLVTFLSVFLSVHRYPSMTAKLILIFVVTVLIIGLLFKKRIFCRYLCPIGGMLGLYSKVGPVELTVKDKGVCDKCQTKQCVNGETKWKKISWRKLVLMYGSENDSCPVELTPNALEDKSKCDFCLKCFEVCPHKNLNISFRKNFDDLRVTKPDIGNALFAVVLMGLLSIDFFKVYPNLRDSLLGPAERALATVGTLSAPVTEFLTSAIYGSVLLPMTFVLVVSFVAFITARAGVNDLAPFDIEKESMSIKRYGSSAFKKISFGRAFTATAFGLIPIMLSAHVVLAIVKLNAKLGYFPFIFRDPTGVMSYLSINVFNINSQPGVLIPLDILQWILLAVLGAGLVASVFAARKITDSKTRSGDALGVGGFSAITAGSLIMAALYASTVYNWLFIRGR